MSATATNRHWVLTDRPKGGNFEQVLSLREEPAPEPGPGEYRVRTIYLSLDPTNAVWMQYDSYLPAVPLNSTMRGLVLGVVDKSNHEKVKVGDLVSGMGGWADYTITDGKNFGRVPNIPGLPLVAFMGPLGMTGATAYFGLLDIGKPKEGETVVVSAAAGAVGSMVGQIAKLKGCRVVGIAGGPEKCAWLTGELGFDAAVDYKAEGWRKALRAACPKGVDVYFENVGGEVGEAVLDLINIKGRIAFCGAISQYNATQPQPGPRNLSILVSRRARMEGFLVLDYNPRLGEMYQEMGPWIAGGKVKWKVDLDQGLENTITSFKKLFTGGNTGKLAVQVSEEPARG
ncbi:NADP-dependent oxidoreductase [Aerophototrophica crusticola]|uniref:NADP-dependent oxidoreductase n=1 Tax=Aerophototrophica crusticola TaxID=1709002 RepID=A0A858R382_9PROT|nr:NADP-dependent oxidoreductase [Rhodospirillaceae bacterium B3]